MSANERHPYKKLPGHRRGVLSGSSVWLGPDHLLLVRSWRVREEYKRFHLSDIQAIAVAGAPRFHISTRSIVIAVLWLIACVIATAEKSLWAQATLGSIAMAGIGAWIYISARCSCKCRLYTAVSGDELPSVYRTWTARKFVAAVGAQIAAVQGTLEDDWAEAVDARRIGPPEFEPERLAPGMETAPQAIHTRTSSLLLAQLFVATMFLDAIYTLVTRNHRSPVVNWIGYAIVTLELVLSIVLMIRHAKDSWPWMQRLVIASILVTGLIWYGHPLFNVTAVATGNATKVSPSSLEPGAGSDKVFQYFDIGSHLAFGIAGIVMIISRRDKRLGAAGPAT